MVVSAARGNVGEHIVMAELLYRGFDAYWADRGNPAFDISCHWNDTGRATRLRVKTTSNHSAIWTVKRSGLIFIDKQPKDDFTVIVDMGRSLRDRDIYIVDTNYLEARIQADHTDYITHLKKDGSPRKQEQGMRCIRLFGDEKPDNRSFGYDKKFASFLEAWDSLQ
ncbi:MAG: hypothetical protein ACT4OE_09830 [Sphingosinicella sp.]